MTDLEEALSFIQETSWLGCRPGLERIRQLTALLGNPQDDLRFIHIAGTNGKGSTAAMLSAILMKSGYRTGLFTSPHLSRYNERIQLNGVEISNADLCAAAREMKQAADQMPEPPTEFERFTALSLLYFRKQRCDIVVWETGMGGRLDSTNVIPPPEAAVITSIGLDHTEYLGDTLPKIAAEKVGIIKSNVPVILARQEPEVEETIRKRCFACACPLTVTELPVRMAQTLDGQYFSYRERRNLHLRLLGTHQCGNAAVVLDTIDTLRRKGWMIPESAIEAGLSEVVWHARLEVLSRDPLFILDGAHNPQGMAVLSDSLRELLPNGRAVFLLGVLSDKDYRTMLTPLLPLSARFLCLTPDSPRALHGESLAAYLRTLGAEALACENLTAALRMALEDNLPIVFCGSLYLAGAVRDTFLSGSFIAR